MSHKEHIQYAATATHISSIRCHDVALSELLEWYFSWGRLTHLWDSQQFVALGTPWKNRHICWIAAHTVLVSVFVDRVCVCVFILDCMWFRFLARASCFVAALCKFSRVQEVLCCWPPTLKKRNAKKSYRRYWQHSFYSIYIIHLTYWSLPAKDEENWRLLLLIMQRHWWCCFKHSDIATGLQFGCMTIPLSGNHS